MLVKDDVDKIYVADDRFAFSCVGEPGEDTGFADYTVRNIQLQKFRFFSLFFDISVGIILHF
jgi:hypothetical protein